MRESNARSDRDFNNFFNPNYMYGIVGDDDVKNPNRFGGGYKSGEYEGTLKLQQAGWVPEWTIKYLDYGDGVTRVTSVRLSGFVKSPFMSGEFKITGLRPVWESKPNESQISFWIVSFRVNRTESSGDSYSLFMGQGEILVTSSGNIFFSEEGKRFWLNSVYPFGPSPDKTKITDNNAVVINYKITNGGIETNSFDYQEKIFYLSVNELIQIQIEVNNRNLEMNTLWDKMLRLNSEHGKPFVEKLVPGGKFKKLD